VEKFTRFAVFSWSETEKHRESLSQTFCGVLARNPGQLLFTRPDRSLKRGTVRLCWDEVTAPGMERLIVGPNHHGAKAEQELDSKYRLVLESPFANTESR
jgi:hypothetical protein